jgi:hypothetical protein
VMDPSSLKLTAEGWGACACRCVAACIPLFVLGWRGDPEKNKKEEGSNMGGCWSSKL